MCLDGWALVLRFSNVGSIETFILLMALTYYGVQLMGCNDGHFDRNLLVGDFFKFRIYINFY